MKELYWISVLGTVSIWVALVAIVAFVLLIVFLILHICSVANEYSDIKDGSMRKFLIASSIVFVLSCAISTFIPSKEELYVIYGVGSVIDYVQENPDAQQLPDKTVKFLNTLADKYLSESDTTEEK